MYKVTLDMPNSAHGTMVELDGLGIFENGTTTDVKDEDFDAYTFAVHHNRHLPIQDEATAKATGDDEFNLVNAFANTPGVTIEYVLSRKEKREAAKSYADSTIPELRDEINKRNEGREFADKILLTGTKDELVDRLKEDDK